MRTPRRQFLGRTAGTGAVLAGVLVGAGSSTRPAAAQTGVPLIGSWFALLNPPSGPVGGLITFNADGTLTQTSTESAHQSPGHGAWQQQEDGNYSFIIRWFDFGQDGTVSGYGTSRGQATVNDAGDVYSGLAHIEHAGLDGTVIDAHDAPVRGTRLLP